MGNSDSRTIFRDQVQALVNEDIPQDRFEYWDMLFSISISVTDVYSLIPDADILSLLEHRKENLLRVIDYCISILEDLTLSADLSTAKQNTCSNAVKILARFMPFLLDQTAIMWSDQPRSLKIITNVLKLMFTSGYSIPNVGKNEISDWSSVDIERLWEKGLVKGENNVQTTGTMWSNRYELIRLLISMCCGELYSTQQEHFTNLYGLYLISKANIYSSQLFYSLINVMISYNPIGNWKLPYGSYFVHEYQERCLHISIQLLHILCLMDNERGISSELIERFGLSQSDFEENLIKKKLSCIIRPEDFTLIYTSLKGLINIITMSQNTYLPGSVKEIQCKNELVLLFWLLVKYNIPFREFLESQFDLYELVIPLIQLMETSDFVVTSSIAYLLLIFSTIRSFSSNLFKPFPNIITDLPLFSGNYSDFIILSFCKLIFLPTTYYSTLYIYFVMIICNISPYIRGLAPLASQGLVRLLEKFSIKAWLLENEKNNYSLFNIIESINSLIQYQWTASSGLILGLIRKKDLLIKIFTLHEKWEESKRNEEWLNKNWYETWTSNLPLDVLKGVLHFLIPQLETYTKSNPKATDQNILEFISITTLVGLLPPPQRIFTRTLEINYPSERCEHVYFWGYMFVKSLPYQLVPKEKIKLVQFASN